MFKRSVRILLVEDNLGLRRTMAVILRTAGLKVDTAPDGSEAFRLIVRRHYDAAVVDMVLLPEPGGIEVIRQLRSRSPATRIFACTAYCKGELLAEALALGVEQIMCKPVDPALLIRFIQNPAGTVRPRIEPEPDCQVGRGGPPVPRHQPGLPASRLRQDHELYTALEATNSIGRDARRDQGQRP
jgi:DNA-binding response OmpR family regulator